MLSENCSGRIGRIEVDTWSGDGIKVQNSAPVAHDLVIESGYVRCHSRTSGYHQDGIQAMGGTRITFRGLAVFCGGDGVNATSLHRPRRLGWIDADRRRVRGWSTRAAGGPHDPARHVHALRRTEHGDLPRARRRLLDPVERGQPDQLGKHASLQRATRAAGPEQSLADRREKPRVLRGFSRHITRPSPSRGAWVTRLVTTAQTREQRRARGTNPLDRVKPPTLPPIGGTRRRGSFR